MTPDLDPDAEALRKKNGLYSIEEVAKFLGISPATLENWRSARKGPVFTKIGRRVFYHDADLTKYVESAKVITKPSQPHDEAT